MNYPDSRDPELGPILREIHAESLDMKFVRGINGYTCKFFILLTVSRSFYYHCAIHIPPTDRPISLLPSETKVFLILLKILSLKSFQYIHFRFDIGQFSLLVTYDTLLK